MNVWRKSWLQGLIVLSCGALAVVSAGFFALPWLLIAPAQTPTADVILHYNLSPLGPEDEYVAQLYRQNVAKKIVCISKASLCEIYAADYARQHLLDLGVPAEDVLTLRLPNAACPAQDLPHFIALMQRHDWQQALLVIRPVASRTDGRLAVKYFAQAGLRLAVTYSPGARQNYGAWWWTEHKSAQAVVEVVVNGILDSVYPECR